MLLLKTDRLSLVGPDAIRPGALQAFHHQNADHFAQGGGAIPASVRHCRRRLKVEKQLWRADRGYRFYGLREGELVLDVGLSNVVRGLFQAASLGYRTAGAHQGQGLMTEALHALIDHAFHHLNLHRIMANYQPWNAASARVLEKLGFEREGYARHYLYIDGAWRDHVLTAKSNPNWRG